MRKTSRNVILMAVLILFGAAAAWAGSQKVKVCHVPPGNPLNFHTITVSENALPAHMAHGDFAGSCFENCETLCDDGDPCTVDACDAVTEQCPAEHPPVDCDDGDLCTVDGCDPDAGGCFNVPPDCGDDLNCTVDVCDPLTGQCVNPPVECPDGEVCDPATGDCEDPPSACDSAPCQNGGTCIPDGSDSGYHCQCQGGYSGQDCESPPPSACEPNPCQNGGTCIVDGSDAGYHCMCPPGTLGENCEGTQP